ncbi:MAG: NAD(P)-dependent oxidoreductase [Clostridia bacterium]|nr:NAD(P)-dependent oxidoreductase [Clostridia bacterium]
MKKDWRGNATSVWKMLAASNHAEVEREKRDFYATDPMAVAMLSEKFTIPKNIVEVSAGEGHLSEMLKQLGHSVLSYDIVQRNYPLDKVCDFFTIQELPKGYSVLTNPPYAMAKEFVEHALNLIDEGEYVIMFLKTTFLESKGRKSLFEKFPPKYVYVHSERIICAKNAEFENVSGSAVSYSWFIWQKGSKTEPIIRWL